MINTILFDLDGTLLPLQWETFEKEYFKALSEKLSPFLEPSLLIKYVWCSTMRMIDNTGREKTNEQVFFDDFTSAAGKEANVLVPVLNEFYMKEFNDLRIFTRSEPYAVKAVDLLYGRGYELVIATNPVFPLAAIKARMEWAGLDAQKFKYITCFEEMHYCKPNIEFYGEILEKIEKKPDECLMVGNDVEEDMVSSKLGIRTYLITDCLINKNNLPLSADYIGTYKEFYNYVNSHLPDIKNVQTVNDLVNNQQLK